MLKEEALRYIENLKWLKGFDNTKIGVKSVAEILDEIAEMINDGWVGVKDRTPEPHEKNDHEADLMLYIPKREGVRQHGIYLGFLRKEPLPPDDGSGNFWGVKCPGSDWTVWGWSHFEEPIVSHWMPLPEPPEVNE